MPTTIENFFTRAAQKQFSRDILFRVKQINIAGLQMNGEDDLIYARSAALPGRDIENKNVRYSGQNFNVPGVSNYPGSDSWSIDFYHDQNIEIRTKLVDCFHLGSVPEGNMVKALVAVGPAHR